MFKVILFVTSLVIGNVVINMRMGVWEGIALNRVLNVYKFRQLLLNNYLNICQVNCGLRNENIHELTF